MSKLHYFTALLLIILLALASGWIFESIEKSPILKKEVLRHDPDYFLQNFTATTMNKNGKPAYQVKSAFLEHYPDDDSMKLQKAFFTFYEKNVIAWTVQANEAFVLQAGKTIKLNGDVILKQILNTKKNTPPIRLNAEQLTIEPERKLAHTKSKIKLTQGKNHIQAKGMRADMSKNKIEFLSQTRSHYVLPAK